MCDLSNNKFNKPALSESSLVDISWHLYEYKRCFGTFLDVAISKLQYGPSHNLKPLL